MNQIKYFHSEEIHNIKSAEIVVSIILEFFKPKSVLDVGCGIGTWLNVFSRYGIDDLLGIDGDFVDKNLLYKYINKEQFKPLDLEKSFYLERKFDLILSLEVAEHLSKSSANDYVDSICRHSDVVIFSAAVPGQGGQNHLNEQWPSYWAEKFAKNGYVFLDQIRPLIWDNPLIEFWYKQNIFLVVRENSELSKRYSNSHLSMIHPDLFSNIHNENILLKEKIERYKYKEHQLINGKLSFWVYIKLIFKKIFP